MVLFGLSVPLGEHVSCDGLSNGVVRVGVEARDVDQDDVSDETYYPCLAVALFAGSQKLKDLFAGFLPQRFFDSLVKKERESLLVEWSFTVQLRVQKAQERLGIFLGERGQERQKLIPVSQVEDPVFVHVFSLLFYRIAAAILLFFFSIVNRIFLMYNSLT